MADRFETFAVEFNGGLISNLSPLQQALNAPGSARILINYEPSIEGGYRRIQGFSKFDSTLMPIYGFPVLQGAHTSGDTSIEMANLDAAPNVGATFTLDSVTYTVSSVSYSSDTKRATIGLESALTTSPADKSTITFVTTPASLEVSGVANFKTGVIVAINNTLAFTTGSGYSQINVPTYGTVLVNGGSQTGTSLSVDGLTTGITIKDGDVFTIAGVNKVYTVTADASESSNAATLTIDPALDSSPADDAAITFLSTPRTDAGVTRFARYQLFGVEKIAITDSVNPPAIYDGTTFTVLYGTADIVGSDFVTEYKDTLFFANGNKLIYTAPITDDSFSVALGSGILNLDTEVTGMIGFRDRLVIFGENFIYNLTGNDASDFNLQPITRDIGCVRADTVQEIGGDVVFLGPDGLRLLSGTERNNDVGLGSISRGIQKTFTTFINANVNFCSCVIKSKSQYRILGFNSNTQNDQGQGILMTQFTPQGGDEVAFAELRGIHASKADSFYRGNVERIVFANNDLYLYQMENGNSFDGSNIKTIFATPFFPITDPRTRKTFYKLTVFTDPSGSVSFNAQIDLDFSDLDVIVPPSLSIANTAGVVSFYGSGTYNVDSFADELTSIFQTQVTGSGFTVSLYYSGDSTDPPYSFDSMTLEYIQNGRR